jgi:hypothetical protein
MVASNGSRGFTMKLAFIVTTSLAMVASTAAHSAVNAPPGHCEALGDTLAAQPAPTAAFIRSYQAADHEGRLPSGLASSAFVYDNALAAIALVACGQVNHAIVIGNALMSAVRHDRSFSDGRVRNAYRAGPVGAGAVALPGWWDAGQNIWAEDPAQDGTSTGNVAWAALALLTLHQATGNMAFLDTARNLADWIIASTSTGQGFSGGFHGYDPHQDKLTWISTEHNVDVYAVVNWLFRLNGEQRYADAARQAAGFLHRIFDGDHFPLGTKPDGSPADGAMLALDVQLWPWMAIPDAPAAWRSALHFAETHLAVDGGFDFNGDRDGVWVEGTAQAALAYRIAGNFKRSAQLLDGLQADRAASGLFYATRSERVSTGLSIDPTKTEADFFYFKRPHLGATAWVALASTGWNPFLGRKVD